MTKRKVNIIGSGGHTRSLISSFRDQFDFLGIFDDSYLSYTKEEVLNIKLKGRIDALPTHEKIILGIGDNRKRYDFFQSQKNNLLKNSLIHKSSIICNSSKMGCSNQIYPRVFINGCVKIGNNNIINSGAIIEHETTIGSHCHISIGTVIAGRVIIGDFVFIGANATIIDNLTITSNVIIGAGSVVIKNILNPGTYAGNPLRKIK